MIDRESMGIYVFSQQMGLSVNQGEMNPNGLNAINVRITHGMTDHTCFRRFLEIGFSRFRIRFDLGLPAEDYRELSKTALSSDLAPSS